MKAIPTVIAIAGIASSTSAQKSMPTGLTVDPTNPSVTFAVKLTFDPNSLIFAFGAFQGSVSVSTGQIDAVGAGMSDPLFLSVNGLSTASVDIVSGQLHLPPVIIANPANPFDMFEVTYTATDFSNSYTVDVSTIAVDNQVGMYWGTTPGPFPATLHVDKLVGTIMVIPAPASLAIFGIAGLIAPRRRR